MEKEKSFNIFITTIGRESLTAMLNSIYPQLNKIDYLTIVCDCKLNKVLPLISEALEKAVCTISLIQNSEPLGHYGHGSRNKWQNFIRGEFIMHADDDDTYYSDAMEKVRSICSEYDTLYIFQMLYAEKHLIPYNGCDKIEFQKIGTPCGVISNNLYYINYKEGCREIGLPYWGLRYGGDFDFYNELQHKFKKVVFTNELIYKIR